MPKSPTLLVLAAGMGSRYGGLKQIDPMSDQGEIILDFSLYDAMMAGFVDVVFVIKRENEEVFRSLIDGRAGRHLKVRYAFQDLHDLPAGYSLPEGRVRPWGTAHAVMSARGLIDGPFAVINSDDYYGTQAYHVIYDFLTRARDDEKCHYAMVGYELGKTLSDNGMVSRGIAAEDGRGMLVSITERTRIMRRGPEICYTEDGGGNWTPIAADSIASMNLFGFTASFMSELGGRFPAFLDRAAAADPLRAEYQLPGVVTELVDGGRADVRVLRSSDQWYGVTYKEDRESVVDAFRSMKDKGLYPGKLWE